MAMVMGDVVVVQDVDVAETVAADRGEDVDVVVAVAAVSSMNVSLMINGVK